MRTVLRIGILLIGAVAVALLASSYAHPRAAKTDVVGVWAPDSASRRWLEPASREKCRVTLWPDGRVTGALPVLYVGSGHEGPRDFVEVKGRWSLTRAWWSASRVELRSIEANGERTRRDPPPLLIQAEGDRFELSFYAGEPGAEDDRFVFTRRTGQAQRPRRR